jgi:hypothetical protein
LVRHDPKPAAIEQRLDAPRSEVVNMRARETHLPEAVIWTGYAHPLEQASGSEANPICVWDIDRQKAVGSQQGTAGLERSSRVRDVLQHVIERDDVELAALREILREEAGLDLKASGTRGFHHLRVRLDSGCRSSGETGLVEKPSVAAADIE